MSDKKDKCYSKGYGKGFADGFRDGFNAGFDQAMEMALVMFGDVADIDVMADQDLEDLEAGLEDQADDGEDEEGDDR